MQIAQGEVQVVAADAARRADQPGHDADLLAEPLRDQLEDRAVAHAEAAHQDEQQDAGDGEVGDEQADAERADDDGGVQHGQHPDAADLSASAPPTGRRNEPARMNGQVHRPTAALGASYWSTKNVLKKLGQADEAAERDEVQQAEPPGVGLPGRAA